MAKLKFWFMPGSCSLAPHILLRELGLDVETIHVTDLSPSGLGAINPKRRVPVLSIDGEIITEVPAILTAFAQLGSPDQRLHAIGDSFTVVDLYLLVFYRWGIAIELEIEKDFPKYTTLIANLVKRDAVVETLEEVKLPPLFAPKV
ncbi:predicted protein [Histoplasma mississippiense (nom. inval.)]|uniref:predicted protein n=1 Tax=Ajellomyces capsulatus (strain NAm1 / WU24) TaxID=2059318 RepID=UPI000157B667|nr:predicted protein [Histoplasma mississippiense (nom. inval.)]EDN02661.1 predicted protein [Histoplasma mississippiense (nom. inval.)]